jgi:antitoxin (DNA-binding transcriptional repressor) of toxin-antitoxin stability system
MIQVNIHEAKTRLSELLEQVQNGEEIIIAKAGKPIAKLGKLEKKPRQPGFLPAKYRIGQEFFDADSEIAALFEASKMFPDGEV